MVRCILVTAGLLLTLALAGCHSDNPSSNQYVYPDKTPWGNGMPIPK